ncbi:putative fungal-specific transcription factor [Amylocarpus encephaloides]|uniref:Fungal-specific transcription factor n=1 Tax=Amylocarpus encephaloides TaxID=45428 RepID=A0A9P7YHE7_9HELO|nr:putative fungal-specific transcription factor [Amylocarpus encephaloides]
MMPQEDRDHARVSRTACLPCRRSKRRCDKKLSSCDLCIRKEIECRYPTKNALESPSPSLQNHGKIQMHAGYSIVQSYLTTFDDASAIFFIAPQVFLQARLEFPRLDLPVPVDVVALIGKSASIRSIASTFFETVHTWLPIVSKRVFFAQLLNPLARRETELSLLALCMLLCSNIPPDQDRGNDAGKSVYQVAKRYYFEVEAAGALSIHVLQALVLIAAYEVCQAIYPAAYFTVSACARYGTVLGIDKLGLDLMGASLGPLSWVEVEERRRVWWAILLLDRFINLGNPKIHLITENPTFDTYLPVDDGAWDDCTTTPEDAVHISAGFTLKMGIFSRAAQATYLLSQALKSVSSRSNDQDSATQIGETEQLRRTLLSLVHLADTEATVRRLEFCTPSAICFRAILAKT